MATSTAAATASTAIELFPRGQTLVGVSVNGAPQYMELTRANRHGLIAGATGTGKTVTLQTLAEGFSRQGVPVFMADVKGDLSGIAAPGNNAKFADRAASLNITPFEFAALPTVFWDVFGKKGHPVRITMSEIGPVLLSQLLELSDAQEGVLTLAFKVADDEGLLLLDLEDLQALLVHVSENAKALSAQYGNVSTTTVAAIQRKLLQLGQEGAEEMFGEPALDIHDLMQTKDGMGVVNILSSDVLIQKPRMYATFLLWLLSELFENLPEAGDIDKPKLVFFFDEAHLLFNIAEKPLLEKVEQVVRLIRSKGVGVYFITQQPQDIPDAVLAQLSNRVQHALRAFTPADQKAVKVAASTFRPNPAFDTQTLITTLAVGEALVSFLMPDGSPAMVEHTKIRPPFSRVGPLSDAERGGVMGNDVIGDTYDTAINRESAYEKLGTRRAQAEQDTQKSSGGLLGSVMGKTTASPRSGGRPADSIGTQIAKAAVRSATSTIGRKIGNQIIRGVLGSILK
jgi:DNA helicase HerA-like ATPase